MKTTEIILLDQDDTVVLTTDGVRGSVKDVTNYVSQRLGVDNGTAQTEFERAFRATESGRFFYPNATDTQRARFSYFLASLGVIDGRLADDLLNLYIDSRMRYLRLVPDAQQTLSQLSQRGYSLGVSTDQFEDYQRSILERLKILDMFDKGVWGRIKGYHKPQQQYFQHLIVELKTAPGKISHVGDNIIADVVAPKKLGMRPCILFDPDNRHPSELGPDLQPDNRVTSLTQLLDIFL